MTDDRIRDGERRARRPGHRTRWPGHCAGTEATLQPRPPGYSLFLALSCRPAPVLFVSLSLSLSVLLFHPRRGSLSLPRAVIRALFLSCGHAMVGKFGEPSWRECTNVSSPLFVSLPCIISVHFSQRERERERVQINSTL